MMVSFSSLYTKSLQAVFLFGFLVVGLPANLLSGEWDWWIDKHDWDGYSHWTTYLIMSPTHFGPNALPVPKIYNGLIYDKGYFGTSLHRHFHPGDKTFDLSNSLYVPLYTPNAGIKLSMVTREFFDVDTLTRDFRRSRKYDSRGSGHGDLYISTFVQLVKDAGLWPDILLGITLKTASGSNLYAARFTDTPGYYFDLSFGKDLNINKSGSLSFRPYGLVGFYVWQTNSQSLFQNDAFLYGIGFEWEFSEYLYLNNVLGGYVGYLNNGDQPMVYRSQMFYNKNDFRFFIKYQYGINDFPYQSLGVGFYWQFGNIF